MFQLGLSAFTLEDPLTWSLSSETDQRLCWVCALVRTKAKGKRKKIKRTYNQHDDGCQGKAKAGVCGEEPPATDDDVGPEDFLSFIVYSRTLFCLTSFLCNERF